MAFVYGCPVNFVSGIVLVLVVEVFDEVDSGLLIQVLDSLLGIG